jgi:hypothetical protein
VFRNWLHVGFVFSIQYGQAQHYGTLSVSDIEYCVTTWYASHLAPLVYSEPFSLGCRLSICTVRQCYTCLRSVATCWSQVVQLRRVSLHWCCASLDLLLWLAIQRHWNGIFPLCTTTSAAPATRQWRLSARTWYVLCWKHVTSASDLVKTCLCGVILCICSLVFLCTEASWFDQVIISSSCTGYTHHLLCHCKAELL